MTLDALIDWLSRNESIAKLIASLLLVVTTVLARGLTVRSVRRFESHSGEDMRRRMVQARNLATAVVVFGLFLIWATEIRTFAISLVAVAAALVIATKELLLCALGAIHRTTTRSFSLGDRIEVGTVRGDVIDLSLFGTTVLEVGPGQGSHQYTGRAVTLPNAIFLNTPVVNETFTEDYVLHVARVCIPQDGDWRNAERALQAAAEEQVASYLDEATRYLKRMANSRGLPEPSVEPRVVIQVEKAGELLMLVRFAAPARSKGRVEQAVLRGFLERIYADETAPSTEEGGEDAPESE